jgi:SNF2 family DNA or RNA helicase
MSRRQKYLYDEMIWHENRKQKSNESAGMMNVLMGLKKICNHPDLFQPRIEESPFNWVPLTIVIAHHMFLKLHFETYKTHILKDFVDNFKANFEQIAEDILCGYAALKITPDNQLYYKNKFADRLAFAKINYERSKRK